MSILMMTYEQSMWAERERWKRCSALQPISVIPAPFPLRNLPLRAPLRSVFATPAHRSAPPDFRLAPLRAPLRR